MSRPATTATVAFSVAAFCMVVAVAQTPPESFTATATVKSSAARASADVVVTVNRYASEQERDAVVKALREGGTPAARKVLAAFGDAGVIQVGERRTPLKLAVKRATSAGQLVTVLTSEPIVFLGAGLPDAKPTAGFDIAVAILEVTSDSRGAGELAPAAKLGVNSAGAFLIEDYGGPVVVLNGIARAR